MGWALVGGEWGGEQDLEDGREDHQERRHHVLDPALVRHLDSDSDHHGHEQRHLYHEGVGVLRGRGRGEEERERAVEGLGAEEEELR